MVAHDRRSHFISRILFVIGISRPRRPNGGRGHTFGPSVAGTRREHAGSPTVRSQPDCKRPKLRAWSVPEDAVVRDEWYPEADRRGGDLSVAGVRFLPERLACGLTVSAQLGIDSRRARGRCERSRAAGPSRPPKHSPAAPTPSYRTVPQLGKRLKRDECWPSGDELVRSAPRGANQGRDPR